LNNFERRPQIYIRKARTASNDNQTQLLASPPTSDYKATADNQSSFTTDAKHLKDMIARYGVAKVSSVLNQQEIKDIRHGMFTFLETNQPPTQSKL
jgi:hypothetical protein